MVDRAGWGRGRERAGSAAGREAVLERRTREVGRRTARLEGEQKEIPLLPATESSLNLYSGREGEVGLPSRKGFVVQEQLCWTNGPWPAVSDRPHGHAYSMCSPCIFKCS